MMTQRATVVWKRERRSEETPGPGVVEKAVLTGNRTQPGKLNNVDSMFDGGEQNRSIEQICAT